MSRSIVLLQIHYTQTHTHTETSMLLSSKKFHIMCIILIILKKLISFGIKLLETSLVDAERHSLIHFAEMTPITGFIKDKLCNAKKRNKKTRKHCLLSFFSESDGLLCRSR